MSSGTSGTGLLTGASLQSNPGSGSTRDPPLGWEAGSGAGGEGPERGEELSHISTLTGSTVAQSAPRVGRCGGRWPPSSLFACHLHCQVPEDAPHPHRSLTLAAALGFHGMKSVALWGGTALVLMYVGKEWDCRQAICLGNMREGSPPSTVSWGVATGQEEPRPRPGTWALALPGGEGHTESSGVPRTGAADRGLCRR